MLDTQVITVYKCSVLGSYRGAQDCTLCSLKSRSHGCGWCPKIGCVSASRCPTRCVLTNFSELLFEIANKNRFPFPVQKNALVALMNHPVISRFFVIFCFQLQVLRLPVLQWQNPTILTSFKFEIAAIGLTNFLSFWAESPIGRRQVALAVITRILKIIREMTAVIIIVGKITKLHNVTRPPPLRTPMPTTTVLIILMMIRNKIKVDFFFNWPHQTVNYITEQTVVVF